MKTILLVGLGGFIGTVARYLFNNAVTGWTGAGFPWGIMLINIIGSAVMGIMIGLFAHLADLPNMWKTFLTTGILGGFTTFSAFSLDSVLLLERGQYGAAAFYSIGSVTLSLLALTAGLWGMRLWLT